MLRKKRVLSIYQDADNNMEQIISNLHSTLDESSKNGIFAYGQGGIKNSVLLSKLRIRGQYAQYNSQFTDGEIYIALCRAKEYLDVYIIGVDATEFIGNKDNINLIRPISPRQVYCSNFAIYLIMKKKYNHALHEFMDCIDDYQHSPNRAVSINEYALYICIMNCFIAMIEENVENLDLLKI